ncbi:unannotated protein [freshwater metagenome]|uniref:Unannotated protein n=1 Tax=freshwater metagenome TaxID=449393 RepID=A0A6J7IHN5_9ZZZZ
MSVHRDVVLGTGCPEFVVVRVIERLDPVGCRRNCTNKHATAKTVFLAPDGVGDRVVDIVQEDLADAGATLRSAADVVSEPTIVGLHTGVTVFVLVRSWRLSKEHEVREERRNRVGVDDLGDDAVGKHVAITTIVIPVADTKIGVLQVLEGVLVLLAPCVEVIAVLGVKELAVLNVAATRVGVGRNDDVVIVRSEHGVSCGELAPEGHVTNPEGCDVLTQS